jgi:hypothetical protein
MESARCKLGPVGQQTVPTPLHHNKILLCSLSLTHFVSPRYEWYETGHNITQTQKSGIQYNNT